jgi:hypothetical protein
MTPPSSVVADLRFRVARLRLHAHAQPRDADLLARSARDAPRQLEGNGDLLRVMVDVKIGGRPRFRRGRVGPLTPRTAVGTGPRALFPNPRREPIGPARSRSLERRFGCGVPE